MSFKRQTLVCVAIGCGLVASGSSSLATPSRTAQTCSSVPTSGNIGPGVYAQSSSRTSSAWSWGGSSLGQAYHWYVFNSSNQVIADGQILNGGGGSTFVSAGVHYWKVQNLGTGNQHWDNVCSS